ncbi:acyl-CoA N-acyltransferase [Xylariaceae sp. FL0804]|nr:acyl-CoA N-acyltransferase [Xylariaceae sp. FL0804]
MSTNTLQFRIATPADAPRLQQLIEAAFQAEDSRPDWTADMEMNRAFRIELATVESMIGSGTGTGTGNPTTAAGPEPEPGIAAAVGSSVILMATTTSTSTTTTAVEEQDAEGGSDDNDDDDHHHHHNHHLVGSVGMTRKTPALAHMAGLDALSTRRELIRWYVRRGHRETGELTPFPVKEMGSLTLPDDLCFVELEKDLGPAPDAQEHDPLSAAIT